MEKTKKTKTHEEPISTEVKEGEHWVPLLDSHGSPVRDANGNEMFVRRNRANDL